MRRSPTPVPLLAALLAVALLMTGCSGGGDEQAALSAADMASSAEGGGGGSAGVGSSADAGTGGSGGGAVGGDGWAGGGADQGLSAEPGSTGGAPAPVGPGDVTSVSSGRAVPGRAVIRTGELTVRVEDVSAAADEAARTALAAGGSVAAEERASGGDDGSAVVVVQVPPDRFDETLRRLAALGEEVERRRGERDVTEQVVDLDTRIATQRASVARVRALLDRADTIGEIVQVEAELTRRTADLESLEARLAVLEEQVAHSTITVRLEGEDGSGPLAGGPLGFRDGLEAGWDALVAVGRAVGVTAGALLPFTPLLLLGGGLVWRSRSRRATRGRPPAPGPASA